MGMLPVPKHWTVEDYASFPDDGNRYEIIDGALFVTPAPEVSHQGVVGELQGRLWTFLKLHPEAGRVWASPADIELADDTVVQPDLFVIPAWLRPRRWSDIEGRLMLAIEVLSPSTARTDRTIKRERYLRAGIPEYWIVDPRLRRVERWRQGRSTPDVLDEVLTWTPNPAHPPLAIDLPALFRDALGE